MVQCHKSVIVFRSNRSGTNQRQYDAEGHRVLNTYGGTNSFIYGNDGDVVADVSGTGKEPDTESNLDNFGARYHTSNLGRFTSPDPSGLLAQKPSKAGISTLMR
jgi:RHS repeat-associated protein